MIWPFAARCSLLALICGLPLHAESFLPQQAQLAWKDRDKPGQTETAIQIWNQAVKAEPGRGDLWTALAKAQGRAVRHSKTPKEREAWADQALASAEKAIEKSPGSAEAYAVHGEALGQWAEAHKGVHSLGAVRQAVEALQKSITLNPNYSYAHMLLAEFYRQSPRVVSVGDKGKALEQARLAVQTGPDYAINHLVLAKILLDLGKKDEGVAELQKVLTLSAPPDAIPETRADQDTAHAMLKDLGISAVAQSPQCGDAGGICTEERHP